MTSQYPTLDSINTTAYLFINNYCKDKEQLKLLKLYKEQIEAAKIVVDEKGFPKIRYMIGSEIRKRDFCIPFVDAGYVEKQFLTDCCVIVLATNPLITKERIDVNAIVYSFALLQLELEPTEEQNVYIDVICSYKANEPDKNKKPMGAGKLLITHIRNMTEALGMKYISLSSVETAKGAYEKMGFKFKATDKTTNNPTVVSFKGKNSKQIQALLESVDLQRVEDVVQNGKTTYLYEMVRPVPTPNPTPNHSPQQPLLQPLPQHSPLNKKRSKKSFESTSATRNKRIKQYHKWNVGRRIFRSRSTRKSKSRK